MLAFPGSDPMSGMKPLELGKFKRTYRHRRKPELGEPQLTWLAVASPRISGDTKWVLTVNPGEWSVEFPVPYMRVRPTVLCDIVELRGFQDSAVPVQIFILNNAASRKEKMLHILFLLFSRYPYRQRCEALLSIAPSSTLESIPRSRTAGLMPGYSDQAQEAGSASASTRNIELTACHRCRKQKVRQAQSTTRDQLIPPDATS
jgi:hypothetical protein